MKKRVLLILFCLTVIFGQKIAAQAELPQASTSSNPIWYYIQVKGTDTRVDRIIYASTTEVTGRYFTDITSSMRNRYLWRLEQVGDAYYLINRAFTTRKLDITRDEAKSLNVLAITTSSTLTWTLEPYRESLLIKSSSGLYAFQGTAANDYVIQATSFGSSDNGSFTFLRYDDTKPSVSIDNDIWYYIFSAQKGNSDKCITDINASGSTSVKFELKEKSTDDEAILAQQWKLIKPENATNDNVHFVNRSTGNIIQTDYDYNGYFIAQSTTDVEDSNGWAMTFIDLNQFTISGLDKNGTTGYLNVTSTEEKASLIPSSGEFFNSAYAWTFEAVDPTTSIDNINIPDPFAQYVVSVVNRRIVVEGTDDYSITHISGIKVKKEIELPVGVYLVTIQGKTKSYLVK